MTDLTGTGILSSSQNRGYGRQPIPTSRDHEITALLESSEVTELASWVTEEQFAVLRAYSERMASHAVRVGSPDVLRLGLVALGLSGLTTGSRDALTILPLYYDAAARLGLMPEAVFRSVGAVLGGRAQSELEDFLRRCDEDKSLGAMGYRVGSDNDGFRYQRDW